jgi:hypothetical protein
VGLPFGDKRMICMNILCHHLFDVVVDLWMQLFEGTGRVSLYPSVVMTLGKAVKSIVFFVAIAAILVRCGGARSCWSGDNDDCKLAFVRLFFMVLVGFAHSKFFLCFLLGILTNLPPFVARNVKSTPSTYHYDKSTPFPRPGRHL